MLAKCHLTQTLGILFCQSINHLHDRGDVAVDVGVGVDLWFHLAVVRYCRRTRHVDGLFDVASAHQLGVDPDGTVRQ